MAGVQRRHLVLALAMLVVWILSSSLRSAAAGASIGTGLASAEKQAADILASAQKGLATVLTVTLLLVVKAVVALLPGVALALGGTYLFKAYNEGSLNRRFCAGVAATCFTVLLALGLAARLAPGQSSQEAAVPDAAAGRGLAVRSGEEVLTSDGQFARRSDPRQPPGSLAQPGWQEELAGSIATALSQGREQVVLVFSRSGCPWCDRQYPVLQEAIRRRASVTGMPAPGLAFAGQPGAGMGGSLLYAPLRVFVLDAEEFPSLAQGFKIEAFPTSLIFGPPQVDPLVARGFVDNDALEQILRAAATAAPAGGRPQQRKSRRRLFR
eukprot:TRINITY_DN68275_c0_g1_i1.p1 TRINITY_DN68275_c0_g1~~TRINITY_DN68275_c0_g1_i1.p1  ORF type:complete len:325 (-),score=69.97 TRINITY_DN68275_c0_g1_i1:38-1012(-)